MSDSAHDEEQDELVLVAAAAIRACDIGVESASKTGWMKRYICFNCGGPTRQPPTAFEAFGRFWRFPSCCANCAELEDSPWLKSVVDA